MTVMVPTASAANVSTPVNIQTSSTSSSITLTWEAASGDTPTGYGVYRGNYEWLAWVDPSGVTTQQYVDEDVSSGTEYTYYLSAFDNVYDESALSSAIVESTEGSSASSVSAPVNVKTFVGGDSIAITWEPASGETPTGYGIYRGNYDWLAWVDPSTVNAGGVTTQRYIDDTVTNGQTYTYYVSAFDDEYDVSTLTAGTVVTQPSSPVAVPTITIAPNRPSNVLPYLQAGKALLEDWYPKLVTKSGNVSGTPTAFTITSAPNTGYVAYVSGTTITIDEAWAVNNPTATGVFIHEAIHVLQNGHQDMPSWVVEGYAEYLKHIVYNDNVSSLPGNTYTYMAGYERAAYLFEDIEKRWSKPNFAADLNTLSKNGGDIESFFKTQTGMTLGELWTNINGKRVSTILTFKNAAAPTLCADVWGGGTAANTPTVLYTCNTTVPQQWTFVPSSSTSTEGIIKTNVGASGASESQQCLSVSGNGTTQGTDVVMNACSGATGQTWVIQSDGTIRNPNANKCLQTQNGSTTVATILEIYPCAGTNIQKWGVRTPNTMSSQSAASQYCIDAANGISGSSSWMWINNCDYSTDQQLHFVQTTPGSSDGTYSMAGGTKCLNIQNNGTTDGTRVILVACNGSAAQKWTRDSNDRLVNPGTGKCMQLENNATALGTYLVISTCNTNTTQKWNWATL